MLVAQRLPRSKVQGLKSKVQFQCEPRAETSELGYAEAMPEIMSEANKVKGLMSVTEPVESLCKASAESNLFELCRAAAKDMKVPDIKAISLGSARIIFTP